MKYAVFAALFAWSTWSLGAEHRPLKCASELMDHTDGFIAYLGSLVEERLIDETALESFIDSLQTGKVINPITPNQKMTVPELHEPHALIEEHLQYPDLDVTRLLKWSQNQLKENQKVVAQRKDAQIATKKSPEKMIFYPINGGKLFTGKKSENTNKSLEINLTNDIEVMSTKVTQKMWLDIMGKNPSRFKGENDYPVENINWWSALVFANELSKKHGFKPAYNLERIEWEKGTDAASGTLHPADERNINPVLAESNPNIYETEGYRLPTLAEQIFIRTHRGKSNDIYSFCRRDPQQNCDSDILESYEWFAKSLHAQIQKVAELKPHIVEGNPFYDLFGLVSEWTWNFDNNINFIDPGKNPLGPLDGSARLTFGFAYNYEFRQIIPRGYSSNAPSFSCSQIGLRLVRTLPKKKRRWSPW